MASMEKVSQWISESFIWGIGITRPRPGSERLAALYITGLIFGTIAFFALLLTMIAWRF